jgi:hypothetical protein
VIRGTSKADLVNVGEMLVLVAVLRLLLWIPSVQALGTPRQIAMSRYTSGLRWGAPETLAERGVTNNPRVSMNSEGNAIVVWREGPDVWAVAFG